MSEHPDLIAAETAAETGDVSLLIKLAVRCRLAVNEGIYCECDKPIRGDGLMCRRCLHRNRLSEIEAVHLLVDAHDFEPGDRLDGMMCVRCTMWPDSPRHHGKGAVGRTSWGLSVVGHDT